MTLALIGACALAVVTIVGTLVTERSESLRWCGGGLVATILAALRVAGVVHPAFQAVAHLWVGGLIAGAANNPGPPRRRLLLLLVLLTAVEACAFAARHGAP